MIFTMTSSIRFNLFIPLGGFLINLLATYPAAAELYKWVDKDGTVRYSDTLPSQQKRKRFQTLSPGGRLLETKEESRSPELIKQERAEKKRLEEEQRKQAEAEAKAAAEIEHHDNVLLMTFTNEKEILEAKDERIAVIDSVIKLLKKNIAAEQQKLENEQQRAKNFFIDKNKEVPGGLAQKIEYSIEKVLTKQQQLESKLAERERIKQQYSRDLIRYRELQQQIAQPEPE